MSRVGPAGDGGGSENRIESALGIRLRAAREARQLTSEAASREAGVPLRYLRMLEEGHFPAVADPAYLTHFLRRYANFLGLDGEASARDFLSETEPETTARLTGRVVREGGPKLRRRLHRRLPPGWAVYGLVLLVGLAGLFAFVRAQQEREASTRGLDVASRSLPHSTSSSPPQAKGPVAPRGEPAAPVAARPAPEPAAPPARAPEKPQVNSAPPAAGRPAPEPQAAKPATTAAPGPAAEAVKAGEGTASPPAGAAPAADTAPAKAPVGVAGLGYTTGAGPAADTAPAKAPVTTEAPPVAVAEAPERAAPAPAREGEESEPPVAGTAGGRQAAEAPGEGAGGGSPPGEAAAADAASAQPAATEAHAPFELRLTATSRQVWVWVSVDGGPRRAVSLERGETAVFRADRRYVLSIDDAGGVEGSLNGEPLPSFGASAQARRNVVIPSAEFGGRAESSRG